MHEGLPHAGNGGKVLTLLYSERTYRHLYRQGDLIHFRLAVKETDLDIAVRKERFSEKLVQVAEKALLACRQPLEEYITGDLTFLRTLTPYEAPDNAPPIVQTMAAAALKAGVGPMAAVAGAVAEHVGRVLTKFSKDVIVENGGDIFLHTSRIQRIGVFAGKSPLSHRLALEIRPDLSPLGICTSSGTFGHSLSLGKADAVVILAPSAALADAVATAAGNIVQIKEDVQKAVDFSLNIEGIIGALAIKDDVLAAKGHVKLTT